MSGVQVAVLPGTAGSRATARPARREGADRPLLRAAAFGALGLYGVLRWTTLLGGAGLGRLMGLLAIATLLAAVGPLVARSSRLAGLVLLLAGCLCALPVVGLPVSWVANLRVAVSARAIGEGLGALPDVAVPYLGVNGWVQLTILLGAGVLLLSAAAVLTLVPAGAGQLRRAGAALPLVALGVIPATLLRPSLGYVEGLLVFGLLVVFLWAERIDRARLGAAALPCMLAGVVAIALGPSLDPRHAWINPRTLAGGPAGAGVETFNWIQGYRSLNWPHSGRTVLEVQGPRAEYWKAENLDVFDGQGWAAASTEVQTPWQSGISHRALRRWTQRIQVTLRAIETSKVIAAGSAYTPTALGARAVPGASPGTWQSPRRLGPADSYRVTVYAPHPTAAQLAAAGSSYPSWVGGYLSLHVPEGPSATLSSAPVSSYSGSGPLTQVDFPLFGTGEAARVRYSGPLRAVMMASPYGRTFILATRLAAQSTTPYGYVGRVEAYLSHGFRYSRHVPTSRYPLENFLFGHRVGYCQHFAGAMALLLRMGGVPARVAVGFTPGAYDGASHRWLVSDIDAHAWVEAWFPRFGWVRFDPTPAADPARRGTADATGLGAGGTREPAPRLHHRDLHQTPAATASARGGRVRGEGGDQALVLLAPAGLLVLLGLLLAATRVRAGQDPVAELVRAFARTGRPIEPRVTMAALEHRLRGSPEAAAYVRALRLARFGPAAAPDGAVVSLARRRALRRALGAGLGLLGRGRAWWALPPRWGKPGGGGHRASRS